jgi:tetratricopeptide (TPR) repeat protein
VLPLSPLAVLILVLAAGQAPVARSSAESPRPPDFDHVIQAAAAVPNGFQRGRLLVKTAVVMGARGHTAKAQSLAEQGLKLVDEYAGSLRDESQRCYVLVFKALLQNELGDREGARKSLEQSIDGARMSKPENRRHDILQFAARSLAEIGDFEAAWKKTEILTPRGLHIMALRDIAMAQARAGDPAGARAIAAKVRLMLDRDWRSDPSGKQPQDQSLATHGLVRAAILAEVALADAGARPVQSADALRTIREALVLIEDGVALRPDLAAAPLATIGLTLARLGDHAQAGTTFDRALDTARRVQNLGSERMAEVAEARWRAGDSAEAKAILREAFQRIGTLESRFPQVYNTIVQTQLKVGDLEGAFQTAKASRNDQGELVLNPDPLRALVAARAASIGPRAAAEEGFKLTASPELRAHILLGAAEAARAAKANR